MRHRIEANGDRIAQSSARNTNNDETASSEQFVCREIRVVPESLYWTVVELAREAMPSVKSGAHKGPASQPLPPGLLIEVERDFPVPISELHAVGLPIEPVSASGISRWLICAARRETLMALTGHSISFGPTEVPTHLAKRDSATAVEVSVGDHQAQLEELAERINLLVGEFEPQEIVRARFVSHVSAAAMVLACALLVSVGLIRRASAWDRVATTASETLSKSPGAISITEGNWADAVESIQSDCDQWRTVSLLAHRAQVTRDVSHDLAKTLRAWPVSLAECALCPLSLNVNATRATMSVLIESKSVKAAPDVASFIEAFVVPQGWKRVEPTVTRQSPLTARVQITLIPPEREDYRRSFLEPHAASQTLSHSPRSEGSIRSVSTP